jgi:hypothetical protein
MFKISKFGLELLLSGSWKTWTKYQALINKYKNDEFLKSRVGELGLKLNVVSNSFESTFNPQEYIRASNEMYIVE